MGKYLSLRSDRVQPFDRGNTASLLHGLYSERIRRPVEERFGVALREAMETALAQAYSPTLDEHAVRRAARALATVEMVEAIIDAEGVDSLSDRAFQEYDRASKQADRWLDRLGMTPAARARLGVDVARTFDLVAAMQQRRAAPKASGCARCGDAPVRYRHRRTDERLCAACAGRSKS
jgi:hypothetical protein